MHVHAHNIIKRQKWSLTIFPAQNVDDIEPLAHPPGKSETESVFLDGRQKPPFPYAALQTARDLPGEEEGSIDTMRALSLNGSREHCTPNPPKYRQSTGQEYIRESTGYPTLAP